MDGWVGKGNQFPARMQRDFQFRTAAGVSDEVFTRAAELLTLTR